MNSPIGFGYMVVLGSLGYFIGKYTWQYLKNKKERLETPQSLYQEADTLFHRGKIKQGFALLSRAIKLDPGYLNAYVLRAIVNLDLGTSMENVVVDSTFVLEKDPDNADMYQVRAQAYIRLEKLDEASIDLENAIRLSPENGKYYTTRSAVYFVRGDNKKAIEDATKSIELGAEETGYEFRAALYAAEKEYNLALADMTKAIQINPESGKYYFWKGVWFEEIGDFEQARASLLKGISIGLNAKMYSSAQELLTRLDNPHKK
jgi:tetratricopeptide (TPR) repeat protein